MKIWQKKTNFLPFLMFLNFGQNCPHIFEHFLILSMILNEEKESWFPRAVKKPSAFLRGITSKHDGDFYCFNYLHSFRTENKLNSHEKVCKYKDFCGIVMPSEKDNILEFNQYMKSDKIQYIIYDDIEPLIKKIDECTNNPEKSLITKIGEHITCGYSISTIWAFHHTLYCRKDCMKKFYESLREREKYN